MFTCPKGHHSQAGDYCDECGAPIGASTTPAPEAVPAVAKTLTVPATPPGDPCPDCDTPRGGRFCEVCGYDFVLAPAAGGGMSGATATSAGSSAGSPDLVSGRTGTWRLVVTADPAYHARMQAQADADAEPIALPVFVPERRFDLDRPRVLIGRRSRSRGIEPEVDLSGPPADPAVSHAHALLVQQADGDWAVVDLDSANGTYVNDNPHAIPANTPTPVGDGDVLYVGAWTALTMTTA
jgi:hypothetical protein